jgi:hypothetical protein
MPEMAFKGSPLAKARSQVGVAHRRKDPQAIEAARRDFAAEKIASYISEVVAAAPPFTPEQVDRLRVLLEPARRDLAESGFGGNA